MIPWFYEFSDKHHNSLAVSGQQTAVFIITAMPSLTLLERGVKPTQVETSGSSIGFCVCMIHSFHWILNLHDTLTSTRVPFPARKPPKCSLAHCQSKKSRMVQFKANSTSERSNLSIYSLVSKRAQWHCHALHLGTGHPKSFSTNVHSSLSGREESATTDSSFPCDKPLNNQMHGDFPRSH